MARPSLGSKPKRMRVRRQSTGGRLLVVLVILSLVLITVSVREGETGPLHGVRSVVSVATTPVRTLGAIISSPFTGIGSAMDDATATPETLSELKAENERLTAELTELREAEQTAIRLEALLGLKNSYKLESTSARIVSNSTDSWVSSVTIDKGSSSGLAVGMPVSDSAGIIGQIIECGLSSSVVRLMSDEHSSISAMLQSSRAQGMVVGSADGSLSLNLVRTDQSVEPGDMVVTSGIGGVFPKGLPLAKVAHVDKPTGGLYYEIRLTPLSALNTYEEVIVITSLTEEQQATADDVSEADRQDAAASAPTNAPTVANNEQASTAESELSSDEAEPAENAEDTDEYTQDAEAEEEN
ncbi:MAG: rod shape-determining protein MreC [Atopobiaceae bacterium]|nr:rod shape-determining protein MreC [Atopobiaceae bacterium]